MKPRLWIASELFYPEETSTGYFVTRIAEGLADSFDVHVVCGRAGYGARRVSVARLEIRHGVTIHRLAASYFDKERLALRLLNIITFTVHALFFAVARFRRGDLVVVVTNPPSLPFVIVVAAMIHGVRRMLLVHDVYPEVLATTRLLRRDAIVFKLLAALARWLHRRYDRIIVLGRDMHSVVGAKLGDRADRLRMISNWGDVDTITPRAAIDNPLRRDLGLAGKFIVQFSGNIGRTHDLASVIAAATTLATRDDVHFLLAGYGSKLGSVGVDIAQRGLTNVTVLPRQPSERLGAMLACSDLTVIAFIADMYGISVPSRMYNVMAAGVPIAALADPYSELALVVAEEEAGWVIEAGDVVGLAALVAHLADDPDRRETRRRGENARRAVVARFSQAEVVRRFEVELQALAAPPSG